MDSVGGPSVHPRLVDSLYVEAMLLADDARHYFDTGGTGDRDLLPALERVTFSCESLKVTTRLMHVIAWLLTQRAVAAGEIAPAEAQEASRRLGEAPVTEAAVLAALPGHAQALIAASSDLHRRVRRLDASLDAPILGPGPARSLLARLQGRL
jgi:regulator of CtrA degradation